MSINERLFEILGNKNIKHAEFARKINTTPQALKNWRDRGTTPPMEYLPAICEVLGVSWEYLITGEETKQHITAEEMHMIEQYRKVLPEGQKNIQRYIEFELYKQ